MQQMSFNDELNQILARAGLAPAVLQGELTEAQDLTENAKKRYQQIFQNIYPLLPQQAQQRVNEYIDWARKVLKKDDRVVWYLRYIRVFFLGELLKNNPEDAQLAKTHQKDVNRLMQQGQMSEQQVELNSGQVATNRFQQTLEHYLIEMEIPKAQEVVFGWKTPQQIIDELDDIEREWKENRQNNLPPTEESYGDAEVFLEFGDGFAWWNLGVPSCNREGDAMGHCGNAGGGYGDEILSLRKRVQQGDEVFDIPFLTFILDNKGYLGEMKGRGNEKPAARYHPYIIGLLRDSRIEGIKGGGYKPENNFSLNDLDKEVQAKLIEENPNLEPLSDKFRRLGPTQEVLDQAMTLARAHDIEPHYLEITDGGDVRVAKWDNLEDLARSVMDEELENAAKALKEGIMDDNFVHKLGLDPDDLTDMLSQLPERVLQVLMDEAGIRWQGGSKDTRKALRLLASRVLNTSYGEKIRRAVVRSITGEDLEKPKDTMTLPLFPDDEDEQDTGINRNPESSREDEFYQYIGELLATIDFENHFASFDFEVSQLPQRFENPIYLSMSLRDFIDIISAAGDEDGDEDFYIAQAIKNPYSGGGWDVLRDDPFEYRRERRDEDVLLSRFGMLFNPNSDHAKKNSGGSPSLDTADQVEFDPREVANAFMDILNEAEKEEAADTLVEDIRRLAGL